LTQHHVQHHEQFRLADPKPELLELSEELCAIAVESVESVAEQLREAFRSGFDTEWKSDRHDPVTVHDRRAESRIREVLAARSPESTVIGEEQGGTADGARVHWYIDPIDGTANFARGLAFWCVSVGAVVDGRPVAGAILDPIAGQLFTGHLGGAFLDEVSLDGASLGEKQRLSARGTRDEAHAVLLTSYPGANDLAEDRPGTATRNADLIEAFSTVRRPGSAALELAHVAAGWTDAAFNATISGYDISVGQLLVLQAGGRYRTFDRWDPDGPSARAWDAPGYLGSTADLEPVAANRMIDELCAGFAARQRDGQDRNGGPVNV
jgi:myo-inositol-1(or 4)-monophosphatase